jgi:molybdate transport system regulatory protein
VLQLKYKIWFDKDGKVFGQGPYKLLMGIREKGSLSESAKNLGMSYNKAYNLIKDIEDKLGFSLVTSKSGGAKGGGSQLTGEAENLMKVYNDFCCECEESLQKIFDKYFLDIKDK